MMPARAVTVPSEWISDSLLPCTAKRRAAAGPQAADLRRRELREELQPRPAEQHLAPRLVRNGDRLRIEIHRLLRCRDDALQRVGWTGKGDFHVYSGALMERT